MASCSVRALLQTCVEALTTTTTTTTMQSGENSHTTTNNTTAISNTTTHHHHHVTRVKLLRHLVSRGLGLLLSLPSPWSSSARADTVQAVMAVAQALLSSRLPGPQPTTLSPPTGSSSGGSGSGSGSSSAGGSGSGGGSSSAGGSRSYASLPLAISTSMHERFLNSSSRRTPGKQRLPTHLSPPLSIHHLSIHPFSIH